MLPRDNPGLGSMLDLRSLSQSLSERARTPPPLGEAQQQLLESPAPSSFSRRPPKHTADALKEHHQHEHLGMHPYRIVLSEVRGAGAPARRGRGRLQQQQQQQQQQLRGCCPSFAVRTQPTRPPAPCAKVRRRLLNTRKRMEAILNGEGVELESGEWYDSEQELAQPLLACYWSLWECGGGVIANGRLMDLIRRVSARDLPGGAAAAAA
jgi:hypothetical protein